MGRISPWTAEEDTTLLRMVAAGSTHDQIAAALGKTRGATCGRASRLRNTNPVTQRFVRRTPAEPKPVLTKTVEPVVPAPRPVVSEPERQVAVSGLKVFDLLSTHCRWPLGDPTHPDFSFCGSATNLVRSYCDKHHRMAYTPSVRKVFKREARS